MDGLYVYKDTTVVIKMKTLTIQTKLTDDEAETWEKLMKFTGSKNKAMLIKKLIALWKDKL